MVCFQPKSTNGPKGASGLHLAVHDLCAKTCEHDGGWCMRAERSLASYGGRGVLVTPLRPSLGSAVAPAPILILAATVMATVLLAAVAWAQDGSNFGNYRAPPIGTSLRSVRTLIALLLEKQGPESEERGRSETPQPSGNSSLCRTIYSER